MKSKGDLAFFALCLIAAYGFFVVLIWDARVPHEFERANMRLMERFGGEETGGDSAGSQPSPPQKLSSKEINPETGKLIYTQHCGICHQPEAEGKLGFAPAIRNPDFLALASDDYIRQTIRMGRPGTAMPARPDLSSSHVKAIIAYLRADAPASIIKTKVDWNTRFEGDPESGYKLFSTYCSACHGPKGEGYAAGRPGTAIGLQGFLAVASDDYILQTLHHGRINTPMRPFIGAKGLANLSEQDAKDIIFFLRNQDQVVIAEKPKSLEPTAPDPIAGKTAFDINCSACHQLGGQGRIGFAPSIRNQDFLAIASDEFIRTTITKGRVGTSMMARPDLTPQTVNDIIAYLRDIPALHGKPITVDPNISHVGDTAHGSTLYATYCASCHGPNGEGYALGLPGTSIGLQGFLDAASDDYIYKTLLHGRLGTPMKPFIGSRGIANLTRQDAFDIIAHLRTLPNQSNGGPSTDSAFE